MSNNQHIIDKINTLVDNGRNRASRLRDVLIYMLQELSSGSGTFLGLDDVEDTEYTGKQGYIAVVNDSETGLKLQPNVSENIYVSNLEPSIAMTEDVGGFDTGRTVDSITGATYNEIIDELLFPTKEPSYINKSGNLSRTIFTSNDVEVGTNLSGIGLTATFNKGVITNGDGTSAGTLVGNPNKYIFTGRGFNTPYEVTTSNLSVTETETTVDDSIWEGVSANVGSNTWEVEIHHNSGTGDYYDSKQNLSNSLDTLRLVSSITRTTSITGKYRLWFSGEAGTDLNGANIPTDSLGIKNGTDGGLINGSSVTLEIPIPILNKEVWFAVKGNLTINDINVLYKESSKADVTSQFTANVVTYTFDDNRTEDYTVFGSVIDGIGYTGNATYIVTIDSIPFNN
jgi:hypothetical protein